MPDQFFARTPEDLAGRDFLLGRSGLDFMKAILHGEVSGPPMAGLLNCRLHSVEQGRVVFRGTPEFAACNPMGGVHGGWYGTFLDTAMGCAVMTMVPKGSVYTTLEYKVNITRALAVGTATLCEGVVQHAGRTTAVARGELRGAKDGRLYASGSSTCVILTP